MSLLNPEFSYQQFHLQILVIFLVQKVTPRCVSAPPPPLEGEIGPDTFFCGHHMPSDHPLKLTHAPGMPPWPRLLPFAGGGTLSQGCVLHRGGGGEGGMIELVWFHFGHHIQPPCTRLLTSRSQQYHNDIFGNSTILAYLCWKNCYHLRDVAARESAHCFFLLPFADHGSVQQNACIPPRSFASSISSLKVVSYGVSSLSFFFQGPNMSCSPPDIPPPQARHAKGMEGNRFYSPDFVHHNIV